jgi:hypothetical protein
VKPKNDSEDRPRSPSGRPGHWVRVADRFPHDSGFFLTLIQAPESDLEARSPSLRYFDPQHGWSPTPALVGEPVNVTAWFEADADVEPGA